MGKRGLETYHIFLAIFAFLLAAVLAVRAWPEAERRYHPGTAIPCAYGDNPQCVSAGERP